MGRRLKSQLCVFMPKAMKAKFCVIVLDEQKPAEISFRVGTDFGLVDHKKEGNWLVGFYIQTYFDHMSVFGLSISYPFFLLLSAS